MILYRQRKLHQSQQSNYLLIRSLLLLVLSLFQSEAFAKQEGSLTPALENPGFEEKPSWFKVSFLDLYEDMADAADNNKRLLLYFYQDGCPYCKKLLEDNFGQRAIAEKTKKYFDVVAINIWGDQEVTVGDKIYSEKQFAEALKVQYTPTLLFFNENRKAVFRANGYYPPEKFNTVLDYVGQHKEHELSFQDYLARVSPQASSGKLHISLNNVRQPDNLQTSLSKDKHLLVMFEQQQCAACDELHQDILKRPVSQALLEKFDIIVLDQWSDKKLVTPSGQTMKVRDWVKKLKINYSPALVYFNADGKEVFRSDAYLKAFHLQTGMDYVSSGSYKIQTNFQRYVDSRADHLREQGIEVDLMK